MLALLEVGSAQPGGLSNLRRRVVAVQDSVIQLDSLTLLPGTVTAVTIPGGAPIDSATFRVSDNRVVWIRFPQTDSVQLTYRVLPYSLRAALFRLDTASRLAASGDSLLLTYNPFQEAPGSFDFKGLDYNGTFARGLSFGNNQDLVLNSSFNLQLAGELGEGIDILAAISDENIPLQPEGNTRQLQEFDRIFVQLSKDDNRLIAGDYELRRPDSYFLNYYKKLQGATFSNQTKTGKGLLNSTGSIAIARGQFARNVINGREGNQGPYKLTGSQGERFIIILSGTERVWIDGQLQQRGLEEDYVIDYNRGELTFTNRRLITKDSRIVVEFDYSDQNYLRSLYALNTEYRTGRLRLYASLLNQQDSRSSTGTQELTEREKRALAQAGDDPTRAVISGIDTLTEFTPLRALYVAYDTLLPCGRRDTILVYSTSAEARLAVRFSFVGAGNGDYQLDPSQAANERVYRWVAPDPQTCAPRGDYAPLTPLVAPQQQLMLTSGAEYRFSPTAAWRTEVALSRYDRNRFSRLDAGDNNGVAIFSQLNKQFQLGGENGNWQLLTEAAYEFVQEHFRSFAPYRDPEFLRDWSLANQQGIGTVPPAREQLLRGSLTLRHQKNGELQYRLSSFLRDTFYRGYQHALRLRLQTGGLAIDGQGSLLFSREPGQESRFLRPRLDIRQTLPWLAGWTIGAYGELEKNDRIDTRADTLSASSFFYHLLRAYLRSPEQGTFQLATSYQRRQDFLPGGSEFSPSTLAHEINLNGNWQAGRALRLNGNLSYRNLLVPDPQRAGREPAESLLGRTDALLTLWRGALRSNTTYELGSGQEPKLEFTYLRVNRGEGTHIWLDSLYNNDGVVQPNEMEIAPFADQADFVKVTTFTDEFIQTNYVNLNQSLQLNPKAVWFDAGGVAKFLSRFSSQSSLKISRKTQRAAGVAAWNPFQLDIADTALVAVSSNIRNVLFFNRADPTYDCQLSWEDNRSKLAQTTGFESRRRAEWSFQFRWNFSRLLSGLAAVSRGARGADSQFFQNKDFQIEFFTLAPSLTILPSQQFRTILRYQFQQSRNRLPGQSENARQNDLNVEATFNRSTATAIRLRLSLIHIAFEGAPNSPVGFALLNGLAPGRNLLWNLSFDRTLARNITLRLSYEGRKTGTARVIHVGRAQVAATF